jgi:hypothetical protein
LAFFLDVREKNIQRWDEEWAYDAGKMREREREGESDLKAGHIRPITEYVRTYISTRAGAWV